jgi:hypothetical protein
MPQAFRSVAALALVAAPLLASAVSVGDGKLSVNGNGSWAYQRTDENFYLADSDGDYDSAMFDLLVTARPSEDLVLSSQLGFDQDEVELEWAFAEWRLADALRFRVGQVKQPLGNYMELQFVGTARPFFTLPTAVYGPTELGASSYFGVGATGELPFDAGWSLQYDVYGGALEMDVFEPFEVLEPGHEGEDPDLEEEVVENILGGRVSVATPWNLTLRLSGYFGRMERDAAKQFGFGVLGLSALYRGERLWVSAEAFQSGERNHERHRMAYGEVAFFVTQKVQLAARYELARVKLAGISSSSPLLRHAEAGLGVNYWFSPQLVLKASVHRVDGTRFVGAGQEVGEEAAGPPGERTLLFVTGAQFAF